MNGRDRIRHPGPPSPERVQSARGTARRLISKLPAGSVLMDAVAEAMKAMNCDGGVMVLDGVTIGPYRYVMPGTSPDDRHAAWYSAKHGGKRARLHHATAIVGRREGRWWLHCHALWDVETRARCGHLLPDEVTVAEDAEATLYAFDGGTFDVRHDDETNFDIFHVTGGRVSGNALIAKIAPHEDICATLADLTCKAGFKSARIIGIGSLIGARFEDGTPMSSPISEVLITPGAAWHGGSLHLPVYCVDPDDRQFSGKLVEGGGPVCVTFEVMIVET